VEKEEKKKSGGFLCCWFWFQLLIFGPALLPAPAGAGSGSLSWTPSGGNIAHKGQPGGR